MNRFLLGALAMGVLVVLTSFSVATRPTLSRPLPSPWTVSQYQLDRAFRLQLYNNQSLTLPSTYGVIITQIRPITGAGTVTITVNGTAEQFPIGSSSADPVFYDLNPPIIARPGDTLAISTTNMSSQWGIAGYTTLPGET